LNGMAFYGGGFGMATVRSNGTRAAPTKVLSGDSLFELIAEGYGVAAIQYGPQLFAVTTQDWSDSAQGSKWDFYTGVNNGASRKVWTIDQDGGLKSQETTAFLTAPQALLTNNGTEPAATADQARLYGVDLSAGNVTLGIAVETAVVTEAVVSDRTLSVRINGATYKICLKV
jgi:hypothetical protein